MRYPLFVAGTLICASVWCGTAQVNQSLIAEAQRQEAEERYRRLTAKIEDLEATIQAYQQRFQAMAEEINQLRQELSRSKDASKDSATQESIKKLANSIEEVDRKRLSDNEKVLNYLNDLRKVILDRSAPAARPPAPAAAATSEPRSGSGSEKGYKYNIRSGDTLSGLVTQLNRQGIKVTRSQIEKANPGVNWNRLRVGQEIFIPSAP